MDLLPGAHHCTVFANPYLVCKEPGCGRRVAWFHDAQACGCGGPWMLGPCGHWADYTNLCPSWGPVDGCTCPERGHPQAGR